MDNDSTIFLKECIADAIIRLMEKKPIDKITADEISQESGVGRATYFRRFTSKKHAIMFKFSLQWTRFCNKNDVKIRERFHLSNAKNFFLFNYENRKLLELLYKTGNDDIILDSLLLIINETKKSNYEKYRERFIIYGLFGVLDEWIRFGFRESGDDMAELMIKVTETINRNE